MRTFQVHLASKGVSWGSLNQVVRALRLFYGATLGHATIRDKAEQAYRHGDALEKRRAMMQAWSDYCDQNTSARTLQLKRKASTLT